MAVSYSLPCPFFIFFLTILAKHQALAPSSPSLFHIKFRFFRVEFSLRCLTKAWQEKAGPRVQLLNCSNSALSVFPSFSRISPADRLRGINCPLWYMIWLLCHIKFARTCSNRAPERHIGLPENYIIQSKPQAVWPPQNNQFYGKWSTFNIWSMVVFGSLNRW